MKDSTEILLSTSNLEYKNRSTEILKDITICIHKGESIAITGNSGSGKTTLGKILSGRLKHTNGELTVATDTKRIMVDQQDHFISHSGQRSAYYSQRYENQWMGHSPSISSYLNKIRDKISTPNDSGNIEEIMQQMHISHLSNSEILQLSNGERKRTQLAAALLQKPNFLVLDQPFVGLDKESQHNLSGLLAHLSKEGTSLIIICSPDQIPKGITKVIELKEGKVIHYTDKKNYQPTFTDDDFKLNEIDQKLFQLLPPCPNDFNNAVIMKNVVVSLGGKTIVSGINWHIKRTEQWALMGHNGAGKTTLLSLITADNPQGYRNNLVLFDKKRGSGESIWDIKKRIGFVSPELHLYFLRGEGIYNTIPGMGEPESYYDSLSCRDVITSGFHDEVGFSSAPTELEKDIAATWFEILNLNHLKNRLFIHASLGEQRLLLLARALVKSPSLLILDEPCQGLDHYQKKRFLLLLDEVCKQLKTTLIYVTHRPKEIPSCVSNELRLEKGEMSYCGRFNS